MNEKLKISISTEWGEYSSDTNMLGLLDHTITQLKYFLENGVSPNREFTERDLEGYETVRALNSEKHAEAFFKLKWEAREAGTPYIDNIAVVDHMIQLGLWPKY